MKAVHLRVERPCVTRRVSECLRPKTKEVRNFFFEMTKEYLLGIQD